MLIFPLYDFAPSEWQKAIVKPLPKKGNVNSFKDLRHINILQRLSKILDNFRLCRKILVDG